MKFQVYKDRGGKWRWRARSPNGQIPACSGESFYSQRNAKRAAQRFYFAIRWSYSHLSAFEIEVIE